MKKTLQIVFIAAINFNSSIFCFKIDRAIVASDMNPMYIDFWPIVAKTWKQVVGVQPTLALIAPPGIVVDESVGDVIRFDPIPGVPTGQHAQMIRMLLPTLFENDVCIISDIDMIPMNKRYFCEPVKNISTNCLVTYHDGMYGKLVNGIPPGIPMCYVAATGKIFREVFDIKSPQDINATIKKWSAGNEGNWGRDEQILRQYIVEWHKKTKRGIFLGYDEGYVIQHRMDRGHWPVHYDYSLIKQGFYHDSHMIRPFKKFEKQIIELVAALGVQI